MLIAGLELALRGKMAFSHVHRSACGLYSDDRLLQEPRLCHTSIKPTLDYTHHVLELLDKNIRAGDVLALTSFEDQHLMPASLRWYREYWVPKLAQRGEDSRKDTESFLFISLHHFLRDCPPPIL